MVVHAYADPTTCGSTQVGFVVSKKVGNAVTRNRVKRRLRHLTRRVLSEHDRDRWVVVRANPPAATSPSRLADDFTSAWNQAMARVKDQL